MLRKYEPESAHVLNFDEIELVSRMSYAEEPVRIMDRKEQVLRNKIVSIVKVLWRHHGIEEATWEGEKIMKRQYPHLFKELGMCLNFKDKIFIREGKLSHP